MLAAKSGHTIVMKILLENQANVNDVDKNKACMFSTFNLLREKYQYIPMDPYIHINASPHHPLMYVYMND